MEILEKGIDFIIRDKVILEKLYSLEIKTIGDLSNYSQKELSEKQVANLYIKEIIIALQSNGLDLKKNRRR